MIASLRAEWLKFRKRPANWVLMVILLALLLLLTYVLTYEILAHPPPGFRTAGGPPPSVLKRLLFPENLLATVLGSMTGFGVAIVVIMAALSAGNEYAWLTWQTILVQKPARLEVILGKVVLLVLVALGLVLAMFGSAAVASQVLVTIDGSTSSFAPADGVVRAVAGGWLILTTWMAFGLALAILFRGIAGAIGGGLTYVFVVEGLIANLFRNTPVLNEVLKYLPGVNGSAVQAAFRSSVPGRNVAAPLVSAGRGVVTLLVYLFVFLVISAVIVRRRDLA